MLSSSPGVPTFLNESLRKTAMQNAIAFRKELEKTIDVIVDENIEYLQDDIIKQIEQQSNQGILEFDYQISINNTETVAKNPRLSQELLTKKYREKLFYENIYVTDVCEKSHSIHILIQIE